MYPNSVELSNFLYNILFTISVISVRCSKFNAFFSSTQPLNGFIEQQLNIFMKLYFNFDI